MHTRHGGRSTPATYSRGRRCIDYGFATPHVCHCLRSCGFEAFGHRFPSDHRAYFFDFQITSLFGTHIQPLSKFEPRLLQSSNAKQVTSYLRRMDAIMQASNAYERGNRLAADGDRHRFAERLDSDVLAGSLASERALPLFHKPEWSLELAQARIRVAIFQKTLSCINHNHPLPDRLVEQLGQFCPEWEIQRNKQQCRLQLQKYRTAVDTIVKTSFSQRESELQTKISTLAMSPLPKDCNHGRSLRQMLACEKKCQVFKKLKAMRKSGDTAGLTRIEIPLDPGVDPRQSTNWQLIDIPSEVLHHLQERNRRHFGQAYGTPFTVSPLAEDLGFRGDTTSAAEILDGRYSPSAALQPAVKLLIQHLARAVDSGPQVDMAAISLDEFKGKLKVWRETTSTSPSGQHLGHYKALVTKHEHSYVTNDDTPEDIALRDELDAIQHRLLRLRLQLLNYALSRGYSYTRWQTIANTHILKEPGNIKIHRTRVIHIYEADYNLAMGIKWRQALYAAEDMRLLHNGQYSSRPLRMASDPVLIEQLQLDMSTVTRKTLVLTNYDATSCYDRIVPNLAMIVSRKFGVPESVTRTNASTLEKAEYRIRTDLGLAPNGYAHSEEFPIYGTGQGSANSPAIWLFLSVALYMCYDELAAAANYCAPDKTKECFLGMLGFVDDNGNQTNDFLVDETSETWRKIFEQAQKNAQLWTDLLSASGGALELKKCSYHMMRWQFAPNGAPILTIPEDLPDLVARDPVSGMEYPLQRLAPHDFHKTLGHYKEPSGTQKEQATQLKQTSQEAVKFLGKNPLSRSEAWTFYTACFIPKLSYPLPLCHFKESELQDIQRTAMSIIVPRCGFNRHTKREVLYRPAKLGGAGFYELYDQQGMGQVQTFIKHWRTNSMAGQLLKVLVAWINYSVGMGKCFLADVTTLLPHLEAKWMTSLRAYLAKIDACLHIADAGIAPLEREHDCYIMDACIQSATFKPREIRAINYCRLYLGAVTLSDLTNTRGDRLDHAKLQGKISLMSHTTRWLKIYQQSPSVVQWRVWRRANRLWSAPDGALCQPLGRWLRDHQTRRIQCCAYTYSGLLAVRFDKVYQVFKLDPFSNSHETAFTEVRYNDMPSRAQPAEVEENSRRRWKIIGTTQRLILPRPIRHTTFRHFLNSLDPWESDLLQHVRLTLDPRYTCFELHQYFYAGTDGSVKYNTEGAFGWVVATPEGERLVKGMGPSRSFHMDSYRAECSGMLSCLRFLIRLAEYSEMYEPWHGVIGMDSQSMLDRLFQPEVHPLMQGTSRKLAALDVLDPEWDLLIEIQNTLQLLPHVHLQYVKGHQDDRKSYSQLPLLAQLNVDADKRASLYQRMHGAQRPFTLMSPQTGVHLVTPQGTITAKHKVEMRLRSTGPGLQAYLKQKNHWTDREFDNVNWEAHGKALSSSPMKRVHLTKLLHEVLPTFHHENHIDRSNRQCMACSHADETIDHVIRCDSETRAAWRLDWGQRVEDFHARQNTYPLLRHVFREAMHQWMDNASPDAVSPCLFPMEVRRLIIQQNEIGWRQIVRGRFSTEWERLQNDYYNRHRKKTRYRRTGTMWQKQLILLIWELWFELWKLRNDQIHGTTAETRAQADRRDMERQLTAIYASRNLLEPRVQDLLAPDLESHLQRPVNVTRNWLAVTGPVVRDSMRRVKRVALRGVRSIRSYFQ